MVRNSPLRGSFLSVAEPDREGLRYGAAVDDGQAVHNHVGMPVGYCVGLANVARSAVVTGSSRYVGDGSASQDPSIRSFRSEGCSTSIPGISSATTVLSIGYRPLGSRSRAAGCSAAASVLWRFLDAG
jgi:hypothetical protein